MLVYVRHGATALNKQGSEERLRGWLQVPLSELGEQEAHSTGKRLADTVGTPTTFHSSDLNRALQTAHIISKYVGAKPTPHPGLRDWNTGHLAGQLVTDALPVLKDLIKNPTKAAPGGEPLQAYLDRFIPIIRQAVESSGVHVLQGHARGATVIGALAGLKGGRGVGFPNEALLEKPPVDPGGIVVVGPDWRMKVDPWKA